MAHYDCSWQTEYRSGFPCGDESWNACQQEVYGSPRIVDSRTVAVDGQSKPEYDQMIKDNFHYDQTNYRAAYEEAARDGKPLVWVIGSWEQNNSRQLIQGLQQAKQQGAAKDAVCIYIDPSQPMDDAIAPFAKSQMAGGHNNAVAMVFTVKRGVDGKPHAEEYSFKSLGLHPSRIGSFNQAIEDAEERMALYKQHDEKLTEPPPPPVTPTAPPEAPPVTPTAPPEAPPVTPTAPPEAPPVTPTAPPEAPPVTPIKPPEAPPVTPTAPPEAPPVTPIKPPTLSDQAAAQASAADKQEHDEMEQSARFAAKVAQLKEQTEAKMSAAIPGVQAAYSETNRPEDLFRGDNGKRFDLLQNWSLYDALDRRISHWPTAPSIHDQKAEIAEKERSDQWNVFAKQATAAGPSSAEQRQEQMLLYNALTRFGQPFEAGNIELDAGGVFDAGGSIGDYGYIWTGRCADTLVKACKKECDRAVVSSLVPKALCDNKVPEKDKLTLLKGLKSLTEGDHPSLTREDEIMILSKALREDSTKLFQENTPYARGLAASYDTQQTFLDNDRRSQIEFQKAVMDRLVELKAVEATVELTEATKSQQPAIRIAAEDALARINPTVEEMRNPNGPLAVLSNPLLTPEQRTKKLQGQLKDSPSESKKATAVIRCFGNHVFADPQELGYEMLKGMIADPNQSIPVRLAASSIMSDSNQPVEAREQAFKLAADVLCAKEPIQGYRSDAEKILGKYLAPNQVKEVTLSDNRKLVIVKESDGIIFFEKP